MSAALAFPTRRQEDFRYADLAALEQAWPPIEERIVLEAGETRSVSLVETGSAPAARVLDVVLAAGARLHLQVLNAGSASSRIAISAELSARAEFHLGAAQLGRADQVLELVTQVTHAAPDAVSRQVVRSVAAGRASVNYLGKVRVAKGADGTDGEQSVRAMLLDRTAAANARPELEIHADDVKCAHGCAVGELDGAALFYMAQRGLPPELAKRLMLQAFLAEAFLGAEEEDELVARAIAALEAML